VAHSFVFTLKQLRNLLTGTTDIAGSSW